MTSHRTSSWVIVNRGTGKAIFETFRRTTADAINTAKYRAVPIEEYLQNFNAEVKRGSRQ